MLIFLLVLGLIEQPKVPISYILFPITVRLGLLCMGGAVWSRHSSIKVMTYQIVGTSRGTIACTAECLFVLSASFCSVWDRI